ncbi:proline--tRNA ligase [Alicyclobacillus sp. SO9]|uniref:proline--tRNA ligase n=1 Tax=Alicyclobacillus sp. SO9 TaxID=2665646 RepID=UPI0018E7820F|nr:proline--tRNA ligase [Alicyclobacillus sp. SO9]QQE80833.1 proline--tRNA ligase [Alicyclobacillus sp. SO9]
MRQSQLFLNTLREVPAEADVASHQLMLRAGLVRQLTAGVYSYLPLGYRVLNKVESIVREEINETGAQEVLLPTIQPEDLWIRSGRTYDYGDDMFRFKDRHDRASILGPTHEEVVTMLVHNEVKSYRQLPQVLYQIQTKFRDEARPRAGLLRGREFRMKDAYSFETDVEALDKTYRAMYDAYCRIFERIGVKYKAVEADAGAIGGKGGTHEFMVLSDAGEDTIAVCTSCEYAANLEKASTNPLPVPDTTTELSPETVPTPGTKSIEDLTSYLGAEPAQIIKVVVYEADGQAVAVCLRGDHQVNEVKLKNVLGASHVELASAQVVLEKTGCQVGFVPPTVDIPVLFDRDIVTVTDGVMASREQDTHDIHVVPGRDFEVKRVEDLRDVADGDTCMYCKAPLKFQRGIEVGHVFKLGDKYSKAFNATYLDEAGKAQTILMGCYGLGTSRLLPAIIEQCHDDEGIIWPIAVAPFHVHIIPVSVKDEEQMGTASDLYRRLTAAGIEVLLDDRNERPGVKFKDSDLLGLPVRLTVGRKIVDGQVELKTRKNGQVDVLSVEEAYEAILRIVK